MRKIKQTKDMKATKTNLKKVCKAYRDTLDLTSFIRDMKSMGYTKVWKISRLFTQIYNARRGQAIAASAKLATIKDFWRRDLSVRYAAEEIYSPILFWKNMRRADNYLKVIIYGNKHLYFAHPCYQHKDYNKYIFAENTPRNVERAKIVNRFLCSLPENRDILTRDWEGNMIVK